MFASLLRPKPAGRRQQRARRSSSHYFSPFATTRRASSAQAPTEDWNDDYSDDDASGAEDPEDDDATTSDRDAAAEDTPLLPIFSAAHLDALPVYNITHSARLLIIQRCETTLSWDQLRSPQVSQFLVKPIQLEIRASHFSRATLYALIANALQFQKEAQLYPGNVGISQTRASLSELLAIRLIKEYTTRELIDALSYDFDPLQGIESSAAGPGEPRGRQMTRTNTAHPSMARTSTLEVAIRAQAKKFLAHPVVVQQLEAIWAGTIVFHSAADSLHRYPSKPRHSNARHYGATHDRPSDQDEQATETSPKLSPSGETIRRSVTLYNPQNASLFKLSRLRVPRYRQIFSTLSYATMLGLFLAILIERSLDITSLEVVFWFWSVGFMLDELVGFSEQGFGLYILSVWNAFDIGILALFFTYYILRLYGIVMADDEKHHVADMAYDVLASTAVLLFPRLFSLLDHYRYFSQLLIAFRLMARDLAAVLILVCISCSGFFVAFTLSFIEEMDANSSAYVIFQLLMGFTPAAWERWQAFNGLGKAIMVLFMIISHFLVVTILITVLTNSFMTIARNANDEHQYLFAVNTISMVKSDALFSYIAPTNIAGWLFSPMRYVMSFRRYVSINRNIIKATHFPVLFAIFAYERVILSRFAYDPLDLIENQGRTTSPTPAFALPKGPDIFSPGVRLREPSMTTFHKDRALDEVFRKPYRGTSAKEQENSPGRRSSLNVVDTWMKGISEGDASSPPEHTRSDFGQLQTRRPRERPSMTSQGFYRGTRDFSTATRSTQHDTNQQSIRRRPKLRVENSDLTTSMEDVQPANEADGEEDLLGLERGDGTGDSIRGSLLRKRPSSVLSPALKPQSSFVAQPLTLGQPFDPDSTGARPLKMPFQTHNRQSSTATILFNPLDGSPIPPRSGSAARKITPRPSSLKSNAVIPVRQSPKRPKRGGAAKARPIMSPRDAYQSVPNLGAFLEDKGVSRHGLRSMDTAALDLASDIGDNRYRPGYDMIGGMPASFQTQLAFAQAGMRERQREREKQDEGMMGRIVLARMNTLEEGFKDILKEVKEWRNAGSQGTSAAEEPRVTAHRPDKKGKQRKVTELEPPAADQHFEEPEAQPQQEQATSKDDLKP